MRLAVSDASPSFPFGSEADPLFTQMLNATNGDSGSGSAMILSSAGSSSREAASLGPASAGPRPRTAAITTIHLNVRMSALLPHGDGGPAALHQVLARRLAKVL